MPNILIAGELHPSGLEIIKQNPKYDYQEEQKKTALVVINKLNKRKTINEK